MAHSARSAVARTSSTVTGCPDSNMARSSATSIPAVATAIVSPLVSVANPVQIAGWRPRPFVGASMPTEGEDDLGAKDEVVGREGREALADARETGVTRVDLKGLEAPPIRSPAGSLRDQRIR